ncbi:MAG: D-alanyl-D-alanine carboxypeptidase family protein [Bradyrhizobium sp.]|nr:D-alanyl-D-alanine carboxypeptidase family protein [Bradyrhizobium sp.]
MNPQRFAVAAVLCFSAVYASERIAWFSGIGSAGAASTGAAHVVDRLAPSLAANVAVVTKPAAQAPAAAAGNFAISSADVATAAELLAEVAVETKPAADKQPNVVVASLTDPAEVLPDAMTSVQAAAQGAAEAQPQDAPRGRPRLEIVGECLVAEACIDQYLFALYERTPKEDTIKETERRKVMVKRKGKLVTVTRSVTRLVDNDFTWKDPHAAERAGMSMIDYVIGGMEKSFKLKLFYMLQAAENAGLQPGITSAFRDDYRQSIASGLKAASNRSFHGGSTRGGYGHGLAADIVSVNGASRAQRWVSTEALWKWVDANGKQYGIGRPYLGRDPPHVGPTDGQEYTSRRGGTKAADVRKRGKQAAQGKPAPANAPARRVAAAM